jgi:hypothetical protein
VNKSFICDITSNSLTSLVVLLLFHNAIEVFLNPGVKFLLLQESGFGAALNHSLDDVICQDESMIATAKKCRKRGGT